MELHSNNFFCPNRFCFLLCDSHTHMQNTFLPAQTFVYSHRIRLSHSVNCPNLVVRRLAMLSVCNATANTPHTSLNQVHEGTCIIHTEWSHPLIRWQRLIVMPFSICTHSDFTRVLWFYQWLWYLRCSKFGFAHRKMIRCSQLSLCFINITTNLSTILTTILPMKTRVENFANTILWLRCKIGVLFYDYFGVLISEVGICI